MKQKYIDPKTSKPFEPYEYRQMIDESSKIDLNSQISDLILDKFGSLKAFCDVSGVNYSTVHNMLHRGSIGNSSVNVVIIICDYLNISIDALARGIVLHNSEIERYRKENANQLQPYERDLLDAYKSASENDREILDNILKRYIHPDQKEAIG